MSERPEKIDGAPKLLLSCDGCQMEFWTSEIEALDYEYGAWGPQRQASTVWVGWDCPECGADNDQEVNLE